jgi:hypothetical protein
LKLDKFLGTSRAIEIAGSREKEIREHMLIGAGIAGLLIVSLFFEMISSSPKGREKSSLDTGSFTSHVK